MERISYQDLPEGMFDKLIATEQYINNAGISMATLELIRLRVGQLNQCAYCIDMHYKELKHLGETDLRLYSLVAWREASYYSIKEKAVLNFTEQLSSRPHAPLPDTIFDSLLEHFNKTQISVLTLAVAQINVWTKLMKTFHFEAGKYKVSK